METIIVDPEMLSICRMCLTQKGKFQIVPSLQNEINECFNIKIEPFDGLSQILCITCKLLINEFYTLKNTFRENQALLLQKSKEFMENSNPVEENDENITRQINELIFDKKNNRNDITGSSSISEKRSLVNKNQEQNSEESGQQLNHLIPIDNSDSNSISDQSIKDDQPKIRSICKTFYKFHCVYCSKIYVNRTGIKKHQESNHSALVKTSNLLTKQCYISMNKLDPPEFPVSWVNVSQSKTLQFDCKKKHQYITRCSYKRNTSAASVERIKEFFNNPVSKEYTPLTTPEKEECSPKDVDKEDFPISVTSEKTNSSCSENEVPPQNRLIGQVDEQNDDSEDVIYFNNLIPTTPIDADTIKEFNILLTSRPKNRKRKHSFKRIHVPTYRDDEPVTETQDINFIQHINIPTQENILTSEKILPVENMPCLENDSTLENVPTVVQMLCDSPDTALPAASPKIQDPVQPHRSRKKKTNYRTQNVTVSQANLADRLGHSSLEVDWIGVSKHKPVLMYRRQQSGKNHASCRMGPGIEKLVPYSPGSLELATAHLSFNVGRPINPVSDNFEIRELNSASSDNPAPSKNLVAVEINPPKIIPKPPVPFAAQMTDSQNISKSVIAKSPFPEVLSEQVPVVPPTTTEAGYGMLIPVTKGNMLGSYFGSLIALAPKPCPPHSSLTTTSISKAIIYPKPHPVTETEPVSRISINDPFPSAGSHISIDTPFPNERPSVLPVTENASKNISFIEEEPMIVETFSMSTPLSKRCVKYTNKNFLSSVVCPPRIKCKPTSLLMPVGEIDTSKPSGWPWNSVSLPTGSWIPSIPCESSSNQEIESNNLQIRPFTLLNDSMMRKNSLNSVDCPLGLDERLLSQPVSLNSDRPDPTCFLVGVHLKIIEVLKNGMCNLRSVNVAVLAPTRSKPFELLAENLLTCGIRIDEQLEDNTEFTYLASMQVEYRAVSLVGVINFRRYVVVLFVGKDNIVLQVKDTSLSLVSIKDWSPQWQSQLIRCLQHKIVWSSIINTCKSLNFDMTNKIRTFMKCLSDFTFTEDSATVS